MKDSSSPLVIAALVLAAGVGAFFYWKHQQTPEPAVVAPVAPPPRPPAPPPPVPDAAAAPPPIQHPVPPSAGPLPPLDEADGLVRKSLTDLLGRKSVTSFLALDNFARHFVATVDNLANEQAPPRLWPVNPTAGRFEVEPRAASTVISTRNAARYAAFVKFAEGVNTKKTVALYLRLYPLFQEAYLELGYPDRYFNDRVVQVIDHLLSTPIPDGPVKVKLVEVQGATRALYQYEDPAMERRSAGQKLMSRIGRGNSDRLKIKLQEIRDELTRPAVRKRTRR